VIFFIVRFFASKAVNHRSARQLAAAIFLICILGTLADGYFHRKFRLPHPPSPTQPNVLLIVVDTLRWDFLTPYGYSKKITPNLEAFARESVLYEHAISTSPWTTPSHASMFTGQYPSRNGVDGRNIFLDPSSPTIAKELARVGFQTAGFINNVYIRRQTGLARGFQEYEEFWGRNEASSLMLLVEFISQKFYPRKDSGAAETREGITNWLRHDWSGKNPFFLFVHLMEPHAPYGVPTTSIQKFLPAGITAEQALKVNQDPELYISGKTKMSELDFEILKTLYENDISYVDSVIGAILQDFRKKNLLDNTLVIFTSDHGEHFGDHGLMSHELSLYDALLRVPLIIRFPKAKFSGMRVQEIVQTTDFFPSILRFIRSNSDKLSLQGFSFLPDDFKRKDHPFVFAEYNNSRAADKMERRFPGLPPNPLWQRKILKTVRNASWKMIWGSDGTRELYSIKSDPYENQNLAKEFPEELKKMEGILSEWSSSFEPSRYYKQEEISREALEELRSLGYIQ
jgi:arylsulfatase A-like enzyme